MIRRFWISSLLGIFASIFTACDALVTIPSGDSMPSNINGQVAQALNDVRASSQTCNGMPMGSGPALTWSNKLAQAAEVQARDLIDSQRLDYIGTTVDVNNQCSVSEEPEDNPLLDPHCHSDGSGVDDRVIATGYDFAGQAFHTGEIIALTHKDDEIISSLETLQSDASSYIDRVLQGWLESPTHCEEMLRRKNHQLGVYNQEVDEGIYIWIAVFAGIPD